MLAAMCRPDAEADWGELAALSSSLGESKQALYCYGKAIRKNPDPVCMTREGMMKYEYLTQSHLRCWSFKRMYC